MPRRGYKFCPYCAEEIRESAIKCRYCQTMLTQPISAEPISTLPLISRFSKPDQLEIERLNRFMPSKVIESILTGSETVQEGERRDITILFADLAKYTALTDRLSSDELKELMDLYFDTLSDIIMKYDGTIDKFIGDAVMALFGAPIAHEDDPERALHAAFEMQHAIANLKFKVRQKLQLRIGICCGEAIVGALGGKKRVDYTAIGDVVNLSNRLQGIAEPGQILVNHRMFERTHIAFAFHPLGKMDIKGKLEPVPVYLFQKPIREYLKIPVREISIAKLIGREKELELLADTVHAAKKGEGRIVHLKGDAGIGKSRLMYELRKKERGMQFYYGRCLSYGKGSPYLPFIDLFIRGICRVPDTLAKKQVAKKVELTLLQLSPKLKPYIPYIQFLVAPETVPSTVITEDPKLRMQKIFGAVHAVIEKAARQQPLILEFEDLQWADTLSLQLLNYIIPRITNLPIVIFLIYRPYFSYPWASEGKQITIELQELSDQDSENLIHELFGLQKLPAGLLEKILKKTEGNPFYAEEVVLYLEQTGILQATEQGWKLTKHIHELEIPDTVQDVVLSRIDRLEERVKRVVQCAAVIGYHFRYRVLDYVLTVERNLERHLAGLVNAGVILKQTLLPELEYLFRHAVTQEVTYNTLLVKRRKYFHGKIARCLEDIYTNRLDEHYELIAHHYAHSDEHAKALEYLVKAGDKCRILFANDAALDFYSQAIALVKYHPGTSKQATELETTIRLHRGKVSELIGKINAAVSDNLKAVDCATRIQHIPLLIQAYQNVGELNRQLGKFQQAIEFEHRAFNFCRKLKDKRAELGCTNRLAVVYRDLGKYADALWYFQEVLKLSQKLKDLKLIANAQNNLGLTFWSLGNYADAVQHIQHGLDLREELGDKKNQVAGFNNLGVLFEKQGKLNEALSAYSDCVRLAREIGFKKGEVAGMTNIGWLYWLQGKDKEALSAYHHVLSEAKKMGDTNAQAIVLCNLGYVYLFSKDYQKALDCFKQGLELAEATKELYPQVAGLNGLLELYLRSHQLANAEKTTKKVMALLHKSKEQENAATTYRLLSELYLAKKKVAVAEKQVKKAQLIAKQNGNLRDSAWSLLTASKLAIKKKKPQLAHKFLTEAESLAKQLNDTHCLTELRDLASQRK